MSERMDDLDGVAATVQLYIDGSAAGDASKLKEAFHEDARMFGALAGHRFDVPVATFFDMVASGPPASDGGYRARIVSIDVVGDAAVAVLAEDSYMGMDFVDIFSLSKFEGTWKIVNKTYAMTGGTPPPMG